MKFRRKHIKLLFFVSAIIWAILWVELFLKLFIGFLDSNPAFAGEFTIPVSWFIQTIGFLISFSLLGFILTGKNIGHGIRFGAGAMFLGISILTIATAPLCVGLNGQLALMPNNNSCLLGNDSVVSWIFHFIIPYGNPLLYSFTYIGGIILFALLSLLLLSKKEIYKSISNEFGGKK